MAFGSEPQNPVFKVLAEIQRYTDVCPNPGDSDLITCRAKRKDGGRCRNPPCTQYERHYSLDLLAEFRGMTECPDTDSFYNDLETYITYSHCKRWHRWPALAAFERWKKERIAARSNVRQRYTPAPRPVAPPARPSTPPPAIQPTTTTVIQPLTAAALQQLPFTPAPFVPSAASATSDGGNSFEDSILETRSVTSNGSTFLSSLPNTPPRNGLISVMEIDDIAEEVIIQEDGADWTAANAARAKTNADTSSSPSNKSITDVEMDTAEETVTQEDATDRISARAEKMMATMERIITILEEEKNARKEVSSKGKEVDRGDVVEEAAINKEAAVSNEAVISNESASVDTRKETITKREPEEKDNLNEGLESVAVEYKITRKALPKANDAEKMQHLALTSDIHDTVVTEENDAARETPVDGLGIISLQRNGSLRDHSPVFQVINSHPTAEKMREGVVYILEHKDNPSLFKIGWSSKSAEERLKQPNNCYGINTKVIYETKRFVGAPHAEKIAQVILRHANIRVLSCEQCKGGHREWFSAQGETVRQTVMQVEEFVQMPAYTLQDGDYKLSPEAYSRVVKQMCDFSIVKMGELMRGKTEVNEAAKSTIVLCETISLAPITPPETPRPSTRDGFFESLGANESLTSFSSQASKSKTRLSAGTKVARKLKHFVTAKNTVKEYLTRSRGSTPEVEGSDKRALGSVFLDLKDKARGLGTKARQDVREFRRDFKEELRRKNDDEAE